MNITAETLDKHTDKAVAGGCGCLMIFATLLWVALALLVTMALIKFVLG